MGILSGVADFLFGAGEEEMKAAAAQFNIPLPELQQMVSEELVSQGKLTPEQAKAYTQEKTAFSDIYTDPRLKESQYAALQQLQDIGTGGGLTAEDRAQLSQIAMQEGAAERGAREAILSGAQARGVGGSGLELMAQLQSQQQSANRIGQRDLDVAAMAQRRAMEAIQGAGALGGQIRGQEFGEQATVAQAKDALQKFNLQNQQQVELANTQARQQTAAANLADKQRIADQNAMLRNQAKQYNLGLTQQQFQNQAQLAAGRAGVYQNAAQQKQQNVQALLGLGGQLGSAGIMASAMSSGGAAAGGAGALAALSDINAKKDIQKDDFDMDEFLSSLTGYKFSYKNQKKHGQGERLGVMAQDVERTPIGKEMVGSDEDGLKNIDVTKAAMASLAGLGRLNERLKDLERKK